MNPLDEILGKVDGGKILDVATGQGGFLYYLTKTFKSYEKCIGIDMTPARIDEAKKEKNDKISFQVMNADRIEFPDNTFDTVAIGHSLHHLDNIDQVLSEMKRVLKPGGLFIVREVFQAPETEQENSQRHVHHWWAEVDQVQGTPHYETFTTDRIIEIMNKQGLIIKNSFEFMGVISEDEMPEVVSFMVEKIDEYIGKLKSVGEQEELIARGEEIKEIYQDQGITNEAALYIIATK